MRRVLAAVLALTFFHAQPVPDCVLALGAPCTPFVSNPCATGLACRYYTTSDDVLRQKPACIEVVSDSETYGGASFGVCPSRFPNLGKCGDDGFCGIDASRSPPCAPGRTVLEILSPNDMAEKVPVCASHDQGLGEMCQVRPSLTEGAFYTEFKCGEGLTCVQEKPVARFNAEGVCELEEEGTRCWVFRGG